jgi:hypothetical protein
MALEVLESIRREEDKAEKVRADAQREGREIIKAVEEACADAEKAGGAEHRANYLRVMEQKKLEVQAFIASREDAKAAERKAVYLHAESKLAQAAALAAERIVRYGSR